MKNLNFNKEKKMSVEEKVQKQIDWFERRFPDLKNRNKKEIKDYKGQLVYIILNISTEECDAEQVKNYLREKGYDPELAKYFEEEVKKTNEELKIIRKILDYSI